MPCGCCIIYGPGPTPRPDILSILTRLRKLQESTMVRAKFRVLAHSESWSSRGSTEVRLNPVMAQEKEWVDGKLVVTGEHPENAAFWSATPSGEMFLHTRRMFSIGSKWYIDLYREGDPEVPADAVDCRLNSFELSATHFAVSVSFGGDDLGHGNLKMGIERPCGTAAIRWLAQEFLLRYADSIDPNSPPAPPPSPKWKLCLTPA